MSVEMAIWRMTPSGPRPVAPAALDLEQRLEDMIFQDPSLIGAELLVIGRQVLTDFGGSIDVLAVDQEGRLHVLELKRDKTPRDVVAQALDYGSWVQALSLDDVRGIFAEKKEGSFDDEFAERFGNPVPDVFNSEQQLTVVASALDAASGRIVTYLAEQYSVPINAVFFRYFKDDEREYLARTWLLPPEEAAAQQTKRSGRVKLRQWNGQDFYVVQGNMEQGTDRWTLSRRYGVVTAGGGHWYSKPLRNLTPGKRVFAYVGGAGYVGVGTVLEPVVPLRELEVTVDGVSGRLVDLPDVPEAIRKRATSEDVDETEYAVRVTWTETRTIDEAVMEPGLFASQVTVCKLRDERTIDVLTSAFGLGA